MRISRLEIKEEFRGLPKFEMQNLGNEVILTGRNGSGKSRVLKLIVEAVMIAKKNYTDSTDEEKEIEKIVSLDFKKDNNILSLGEASEKILLINYSHYDLPLQSPKYFTPYVISKALSNLERCDFEETARDVLLFIHYLAQSKKFGDENEVIAYNKFKEFILKFADLELDCNEDGNPILFGQKLDEVQLSPGQQYLLRMCVALYCNKIKNDEFILFLDEPETHLHPGAIWNLIEQIRKKYGKGQIWIATHSITLISMFDASSVWYFNNDKKLRKLGSNSAGLIDDLLGDDRRRFLLQQFITSPDAYACNCFALECLIKPEAVDKIKIDDPQIKAVVDKMKESQNIKSKSLIVVDYGAGKGRLVDGLGTDYPNLIGNITYYAYDINLEDSEICKEIMKKYDLDNNNYFNDYHELEKEIGGKADIVFLVNVLHEIPPQIWPDIFIQIKKLLNQNGELIIVELEEFTYGEQPYDNGFMVIQPEAFYLIDPNQTNCRCERKKYNKNNAINCFLIPWQCLEKIDIQMIEKIVEEIKILSLKKIAILKTQKNRDEFFINGIKLAFWTQQLANAELYLSNIE